MKIASNNIYLNKSNLLNTQFNNTSFKSGKTNQVKVVSKASTNVIGKNSIFSKLLSSGLIPPVCIPTHPPLPHNIGPIAAYVIAQHLREEENSENNVKKDDTKE